MLLSKPKTDFEIAWELSKTNDKPFSVSNIRSLFSMYNSEEISLSKLVEELNVAAYKWAKQSPAPSIAVEEKEWEKELRYMQRLNYNGQKILDEVRKEFEDYKNKYPAASPKEEKKY